MAQEPLSHVMQEQKPSEDPAGGCPYIGFNVSTNFLDAQSLWDATMAFSIAEHLQGGTEVNLSENHKP